MTAAVPQRAPATYQEWLEQLNYLRGHPGDRARMGLLREGTLCGGGQVLDLFLCRLDETIRHVLSRRIRQFLSQVDEAFAEHDLDYVELLSIRFCGDLSASFFFEDLPCIPPEQRAAFVRGFSGQLEDFWNNFLNELERDAEESGSGELEDLHFRLARLSGPWSRGEERDDG